MSALHLVLEARLRRGLTSVIDATNTDPAVRARILQAAGRYGMPTVALLVTTPLPVALERNAARPDDRRVPENILRAQYAAAFAARPRLQEEGFGQVLFASDIDRLGPLLQRLSTNRTRRRPTATRPDAWTMGRCAGSWVPSWPAWLSVRRVPLSPTATRS